MRKLLVILWLCLIATSAFGQFQQKPMLGQQINWADPLSKGLVGLWLLNEGSGNIVSDLSGNGNTGIFNDDPQWVTGKFGSAIDFDGTGDYISIGDFEATEGLGAISFSIWVKFPSSGISRYLMAKVNNAELYIGSNNYVYFKIRNDSDVNVTGYYWSGIVPATNTWHHIVGTYDGSKIIVYLNSKPDISFAGNQTGLTDSSAWAFNIGERAGTYYTGQLDIPMVYNRALSASESVELYREPFGMFVKDDIAILATAAVPPPPPSGQVITIIMTSIPLFLIPFFFIKRRKLCR